MTLNANFLAQISRGLTPDQRSAARFEGAEAAETHLRELTDSANGGPRAPTAEDFAMLDRSSVNWSEALVNGVGTRWVLEHALLNDADGNAPWDCEGYDDADAHQLWETLGRAWLAEYEAGAQAAVDEARAELADDAA